MRQIRWGRYEPFGPRWYFGFPPKRVHFRGHYFWIHGDCTVAAYDHEGD